MFISRFEFEPVDVNLSPEAKFVRGLWLALVVLPWLGPPDVRYPGISNRFVLQAVARVQRVADNDTFGAQSLSWRMRREVRVKCLALTNLEPAPTYQTGPLPQMCSGHEARERTSPPFRSGRFESRTHLSYRTR